MGAGGAAGIQAGIDAAGITEICSLADRIVHGIELNEVEAPKRCALGGSELRRFSMHDN